MFWSSSSYEPAFVSGSLSETKSPECHLAHIALSEPMTNIFHQGTSRSLYQYLCLCLIPCLPLSISFTHSLSLSLYFSLSLSLLPSVFWSLCLSLYNSLSLSFSLSLSLSLSLSGFVSV